MFGSSLPYTTFRGAIKVRVILDIDSRVLTIFTPSNPNGEQFFSLPDGPLFPAF